MRTRSFTEGTWTRWFAWCPVRAYGFTVNGVWHPSRWVWLRQVEWTDGAYRGEYAYRLPEVER